MHPVAYKDMYRLEKDHWWFCAKREFIRQMLLKVLTEKEKRHRKILDCGCGTGINLAFLSQFGVVQGIDNNDIAIEYCEQNGFKDMVQKADVHHLDKYYNSFNLVTALDVLYHQSIRGDILVLSEFYKVLKPEGLLLITDSAFNFLKSTHDIAVKTRERYTLKGIRERVQKAGFEVVHQTYLFFATFPVVLSFRMLKKVLTTPHRIESDVRPVPEVLNNLLRILLGFEARLAARYCLPVGSSVMVLARKIS